MKVIEIKDVTAQNILTDLLKRSTDNYDDYMSKVQEIVNDVKLEGDEAVLRYTKKFDQVQLTSDTLKVREEEIQEAYTLVDPKLIEVMRRSIKNVEDFHLMQKQKSWFDSKENGILLGQKVTAIEKAGVYVPGGKAVYPSSVIMNIIPAKVAGVNRIIMTTPPDKETGKINPFTLVAANECGVAEIYKVGGAHAIAALAYGTDVIPKVDKIVGPGNIYVALAKRAVYGHVNIDSIAGPSEVLVIADETANPVYIAADLLSQAEHDEIASSILVTTSRDLANQVLVEIDKFLNKLSRKSIMEKSLENFGFILIANDLDDAVRISDEIAPEHLEIMTKDPFMLMSKVKNAGAIFLGEYSPEPLGDYMAGPNHVLPTNGTAKFFSPLSVDDFIKKSSIISYSRSALETIYEDIITFAEAEQFTAHGNSVRVRFEKTE